jgi:riboflavin kinase/FMN adenylyltransferase
MLGDNNLNNDQALGFAATVGFFDGVHAGHRFLINELIREARSRDLKSMIITFRIHPRKVLQRGFQPRLLTDPEEKKALLRDSGVDRVVELDFSPEMAALTAREFIQQLLSSELQVKLLLVGHDHRFGKNREEGFPAYVQYGLETGMEVLQAGRFSTDNAPHISSSEIRHAIQRGNIPYANNLLGYRYGFTGQVVSGYQVGRKIGFPTANLKMENEDKLIPGSGVYAVDVIVDNMQFRGMLNIGIRPTLTDDNRLSIEVHIIGFEKDIYHQLIKIIFLEKIREEQKFTSINELVERLAIDKKLVMALK